MFSYDIMQNLSVLVGLQINLQNHDKSARKMFLGKILMIFCDLFQ